MTIEEIQTALAELVAAMVEKGVPKPQAELTIRPTGQKHYVYLRGSIDWRGFGGDYSDFSHGNTVAEAFDEARKAIADLPSPEEAVTREYLGKVAEAIDYGTKHSIDDKYVTPPRSVTKAMTDNLLTKEPT